MSPAKKSRARRKPGRPRSNGDPFGLQGWDLRKSTIREDEIPKWFAEMRATLEERWRRVEDYSARSVLAARLGRELARSVTASEARAWFEDARQDHLWRLHLLDGRTKEGKLYRAYVAINLRNEFFAPDPGVMQTVRKLVLFLLDLEEPPGASHPPFLMPPTTTPEDYVKMRGTRMLLQVPMQGVTIPRRYTKRRARRLAEDFLDARSKQYWKLVHHHLKSTVSKSMSSHAGLKKAGLLESAFGRPSVRLAAAIQDPMLRPFEAPTRRAAAITTSQLQEAARLFRKWYPVVQRHLRGAKEEAGTRALPAEAAAYVAARAGRHGHGT
jgi:hypothetical protein